VLTLATVTLSLISFGYFISNTELKYEDGCIHIIKKGYSINNITKNSCTVFKEQSTFDSFKKLQMAFELHCNISIFPYANSFINCSRPFTCNKVYII
jgi:hypothetical protein